MYSELRNKEFGLTELIKAGVKISLGSLFVISIITLLIDVPIHIVGEFFVNDPTATFRYYSYSGWISLLSHASIIFITEQNILSKKVTVWSALRRARSCYSAAFASRLLFGILLILRLILIIPGITFLVNTAFFLHAVALRSQGWKAALDYSRNLVEGKFWHVLRTYLILFFVFTIPSFIFYDFAYLIFELDGSGAETSALYASLIDSLISPLLGNLYIVVMTVFFLNLDYRKSLDD